MINRIIRREMICLMSGDIDLTSNRMFAKSAPIIEGVARLNWMA